MKVVQSDSTKIKFKKVIKQNSKQIGIKIGSGNGN